MQFTAYADPILIQRMYVHKLVILCSVIVECSHRHKNMHHTQTHTQRHTHIRTLTPYYFNTSPHAKMVIRDQSTNLKKLILLPLEAPQPILQLRAQTLLLPMYVHTHVHMHGKKLGESKTYGIYVYVAMFK